MKKIKTVILRWRYRRLYSRLFLLYLAKTPTAGEAAFQASTAFSWLTGRDWNDWC